MAVSKLCSFFAYMQVCMDVEPITVIIRISLELITESEEMTVPFCWKSRGVR